MLIASSPDEPSNDQPSKAEIDVTIGPEEILPISAVPHENPESIQVGLLNKLEVPAEDIGADDDGQDVDFSAQMTPSIRRPEQYEKFTVASSLTMTTRLLAVRSGPGGIDTKYYHVTPSLRGPIISGLRDVLVVPWWSHRDKRWYLWIVNHNPGNSWFDSMQPLLKQSPEYYVGKVFTVEANRANARYQLRWHEAPSKVPSDPGRTVNEMLGQALGPKGFIRVPDHPVYRQLTAGEGVY